MRRTIWWVVGVGLAVSLVVAGVVSYYASSEPDGLNKVAADHGLDSGAVDSATAGLPTADYAIAGIASERISGGLAGILGVAVVGLIGFGLFRLLAHSSSKPPGIADTADPS